MWPGIPGQPLQKKEYIPLAVISEALGHNSQKTTQIYLASLDNRILDEANLKIARAIKKWDKLYDNSKFSIFAALTTPMRSYLSLPK